MQGGGRISPIELTIGMLLDVGRWYTHSSPATRALIQRILLSPLNIPKTRAPSRGLHRCVRYTHAHKMWDKGFAFSTNFLSRDKIVFFIES